MTTNYRPINKFITPILFTGVTSSTLNFIKQINPAALSTSRVVLALSLDASGSIRILVLDFDNDYEPSSMTITEQTFTYDANVRNWFIRNPAGAYKYSAHSIVTPIDDSRFLITIPATNAAANKTIGVCVYSIENGSIRQC